MRIAVTAVVLLAALTAAAAARAYLPPVADLYELLHQQQRQPPSATLELRATVYDTEPGSGAALDEDGQPLPRPLPSRTFRQRVTWLAGGTIAIETLSDQGEPLHLYLEADGQHQQINLSAGRRFTGMDVQVPYLAFLEGEHRYWLRALSYWGITPETVTLDLRGKAGVQYRLVDAEGNEVWIDRELLRPVQLRTTIDSPEGPLRLAMTFAEFLEPPQRDWVFPGVTTFSLNGQTFKTLRVVSIDTAPEADRRRVEALRQRLTQAQREAPRQPPAAPTPSTQDPT